MLTYYKLGSYVSELEPRRHVTMNTDGEKVDYFKAEAARTDVPPSGHHQHVPDGVPHAEEAPRGRVIQIGKIPRVSRLGAIGAPSAARGGIRPGDPGNLVPALSVVFLRYRP